jgi:histone deacetylase complex subunit SAP18
MASCFVLIVAWTFTLFFFFFNFIFCALVDILVLWILCLFMLTSCSIHMQTCPLLLRVFTKIGGHHTDEDFAVRGKEPKDEVQIYTWKDATLRELTDLVKEVAPEARRRDAMLSFAFVYPDKHGRFVVKEVGRTTSYPNGRRPDNGSKALAELSFQIGDYLDVAIL